MLRKLLTVIETGVPLLTTATLGRFKSSSVALSERLSIRFARGLKKPSRTADQICGSRLSTVVVLPPNLPLILLELLTLGSANTCPTRPTPDSTAVRISCPAISEQIGRAVQQEC